MSASAPLKDNQGRTGTEEGEELRKLKSAFALPPGAQGDRRLLSFKAAFDRKDSVGRGTITLNDVAALVKELGWSKPTLEADLRLWLRETGTPRERIDFTSFADAAFSVTHSAHRIKACSHFALRRSMACRSQIEG